VEAEGGGLAVRLDRKAETRIVPFRAKEWVPDVETRLQPMQLARITYDADKALRSALGEYGLPEWPSLPEPQRIAWSRGLPEGANEIRHALRAAILKVLA
jgi:hypothetical protein